MSSIWNAIQEVFISALRALHGLLEPVFGLDSWGVAIIALTVVVRVLLLPLAIKQTRSMRAMQSLQPKIKKLQAKYKVDKELLRKDPDTYKKKKAQLNEEMMALYKTEGVNPASGCLPLLAQAPIFFALYSVLRNFAELKDAPFYFVTSQLPGVEGGAAGLGALTREAGWPGWVLIILMGATMFWSQRQMIARNASSAGDGGTAAQQQKIMMYVMPVFLAFISQSLPLGVLLYWVTTNAWQMGQQAVILREVEHDIEAVGPKVEQHVSGKPGLGSRFSSLLGRASDDAPASAGNGRGSTAGSAGASKVKRTAAGRKDAAAAKSKGASPSKSKDASSSKTKGGSSSKAASPPKSSARKKSDKSSPGAKSSSNGSSKKTGSNGSSGTGAKKRDHLPGRRS